MGSDLSGKILLLTGIGGGLGREAALCFAARGAIVVGCDLNEETCAETVTLVRERGGIIEGTANVDLGDARQAKNWVEGAGRKHGHIDILYNNASAAKFAPISEMSEEDWQYTMRNEIDLIFFATKYAWPYLAKHGGVVINIASTAGWGGSKIAGLGAHAAAKGAVVSFTRQVAVEGAPVGIRAVSISPGFIATPGTEEVLKDPAIKKALLDGVLLERAGKPNEVISLALLAASEDGAFMTGSDYIVDGGLMAM